VIVAVLWIAGVILWCVVWGALGTAVGAAKGRKVLGALLGIVMGVIGIIIVAVLPPTRAVVAARDARLAQAIQSAVTPQSARESSLGAASSVKEVATSSQSRQELIAEAILRDPTLADPSDPDALRRLNAAIEELIVERRTRSELEVVLALQGVGAADGEPDPGSDLSLAADPTTDGDTLWRLIRSDDLMVAVAAARNPNLPLWVARRTLWESENEALQAVVEQVVSERTAVMA
jgi:hypothetical protein